MDIPGLPARRAALKLVDAVLRRGETLDQAGHNAVQGISADSDKALARAIAAEALRWLTDLDALIDSATPQILPEDAKPRAVLRLMLAQWLRLGTPPHAVVATALPLLVGGPKRLAHGVFAALTRRGATLPAQPTLPPAVAARWGGRADAIAAALTGLEVKGQVSALEGYAAGGWWVQDAAAALAVPLLGPVAGERVLDLCAAPGGKTLQLAAAGARVVALDMSGSRMDRLRENLARCGLSAELVVADALHWQPDEKFDAVLLDAPCSATGTVRRHPDLPFVKDGSDVADLVALQAALLDRALGMVRPGGRVVFCTCSLLPEEGEGQLAAALARHPGLRADRVDLPGVDPAWWTDGGGLRLRPDYWAEAGGMDGFFMARLLV